MRYIYVDASYCKCVYMGSEEAYQRYQKLALDKQVAAEERTIQRRDKPAQMHWGDFRFEDAW
jgi:hypothetical protein